VGFFSSMRKIYTVFHTSVYVSELICYICCSDLPNIIEELNKTVAVLTSTTAPRLPCSSPSAQPTVSDNLDSWFLSHVLSNFSLVI